MQVLDRISSTIRIFSFHLPYFQILDIFVLDALNFCFWPCEGTFLSLLYDIDSNMFFPLGFEYEDLAIALKIALSNDRSIFSGEKLASLTEESFLSWFSPSKLPPNVFERLLRLRELGNALVASKLQTSIRL